MRACVGLNVWLFKSSAFIVVNEIEAILTMDQKDRGAGSGIVTCVSATRANFLLAAAAATPGRQRRRGLPLVGGAATQPRRQQARLSALSSYFLRISIFPFIYFLTSRADLKPACGGKKSRRIIRPRTFSGALSFFLSPIGVDSFFYSSIQKH